MSDTPKFEVIDRRKRKADEEQESQPEAAAKTTAAPAEPGAGPRLVVNEGSRETGKGEAAQKASEQELGPELPPPPTAAESKEQKAAYDASSQRLEDLIRAQNPAAGAPPQVTFENLVQQFYVTSMIQMGAGTPDGQRPQIDILGARNTIDLLGVLAEKTRGNLSEAEDRALQSVLFDARMAFLELTSMISMQGVSAPPPPTGKL
jgi:type IV secretory pathway VirB10-like protein